MPHEASENFTQEDRLENHRQTSRHRQHQTRRRSRREDPRPSKIIGKISRATPRHQAIRQSDSQSIALKIG